MMKDPGILTKSDSLVPVTIDLIPSDKVTSYYLLICVMTVVATFSILH